MAVLGGCPLTEWGKKMDLWDLAKQVASKAITEAVSQRGCSSKSVAEWDREWICIGKFKTADLSPYNHCVCLYRHVINGETMYVGRAVELNNGSFRKRLSDYRRESDSARKHLSGRTIHEHLDEITTYLLIVGDDQDAVEITKNLEGLFISWYDFPAWNKQINI